MSVSLHHRSIDCIQKTVWGRWENQWQCISHARPRKRRTYGYTETCVAVRYLPGTSEIEKGARSAKLKAMRGEGANRGKVSAITKAEIEPGTRRRAKGKAREDTRRWKKREETRRAEGRARRSWRVAAKPEAPTTTGAKRKTAWLAKNRAHRSAAIDRRISFAGACAKLAAWPSSFIAATLPPPSLPPSPRATLALAATLPATHGEGWVWPSQIQPIPFPTSNRRSMAEMLHI